MAYLWQENVRSVVPYTPGEQPNKSDIIKLNTNENPYPPTKRVKEAIDNANIDELRLYPNVTAAPIVSALSKYYKVNENQLFVGVGSDDVLAMSFLTFFNSKKPILFPDISYSFYSVWADLFKIPYKTVALDDEFKLVKESFMAENGGIIFPNPNAPTAIAVGLDFIEDVVCANPSSVVIVDEAYVDFGATSALPLIEKYDNLLVVGTFSKSRSMAGVRIGFAMGNEALIKALSDVKFSYNSYTMNRPSIEVGVCAIEDDEYFRECVEKIVKTRERSVKEFEKRGFFVTDSKTNFLFVTHKDKKASDIFKALKEKDIFVRYFNLPRIDNYLRVTIGTDEQMSLLFAALDEIL